MHSLGRPPLHTVSTGQVFGRWTVLNPGLRKGGLSAALCQCACGTERIVLHRKLTSNHSKSCGCLRRDLVAQKNTVHGLSGHPLYSTWEGMLARCENPKATSYQWYGARGIQVCERWHDLATFISDIEGWLGPRPEGMTLDRIFNDHDYRLDNVRWADTYTQNNNQRMAA